MSRQHSRYDHDSSVSNDIDPPAGLPMDLHASLGNQFAQEQMRATQSQQASLFLLSEPMIMPRPMIWPYLEPFVRPMVEPMVKPTMVDPLPPMVAPMDGINPEIKVDPKVEPQTEGGGGDSVEQENDEVVDTPETDRPEIEGPTRIEPGQNDGQDRPKSTDGEYEPPIPTPKPSGPVPDHFLPPEQLPPKVDPAPPFKLPRIFKDL